MTLDTTRSRVIPLILFVALFPAKVLCSCDTVDLQPHHMLVNETDQGVIIKSMTYSLPGVTWDMTLSTAHTMATAQLGEYIKLNFDNTSLELEVVKALDKEELYSRFKVDIESIILQMSCSTSGSRATRTNLTLIIIALNEFPPEIHGGPYNVSVREDTSNGSTVLTVNVTDPDVPNTQLLYTTKAIGSTRLGSEYLGFPQPNNPEMKLLKNVDYDKLVSDGINPIFHFLLNVTDGNGDGQSSQTNITVVIEDVDDLPPIFLYPGCGKHCATTQYRIITEKTHRGPLTVLPVSLQAVDQDSLNYSIVYSIRPDQKNYHLSFKIDDRSGIITQVGDVNRTGIISVKAEENSTKRHDAVALVLIEFPKTTVNQPEPSTAEDNTNGLVIGLIILAIAAAALLYFVVVLVLLHKKLKKQITPFEVDDKMSKELQPKVPKTSEVNEVKPIPRESGIPEERDIDGDKKDPTDNTNYEKNALSIYNVPTPSERNNLLEPIKSRESQQKRKKKRKKKKDVLKRLGHETQQQESDNTETKHRENEEHTENNPGNVENTHEILEGNKPRDIQALDGHFVDENSEIMV